VVELEAEGTIAHLLAAVERAGAHVESVRVSEEAGRRTADIVLSGETITPEVVDEVAGVDGVATVEWAR
jgi:ACT domain-containing protein